MKNYKHIFACVAILLSGSYLKAQQKSDQQQMQKAPMHLVIDGKLNEWGDSLAFYDAKSKMSYAIANDDSSIYIAAFVRDNMIKRKIMRGGITVSVNPDGKKHKTYSVTYPVPNAAASLKGILNDDANDEPRQQPNLLQSTSIKVAGFKDVESEVITTSNTYGIKASLSYDAGHNLAYEMAIPINMLEIKHREKDIAVNISVNGIERPNANRGGEGGGTGMGGEGGGGRGGMGGGGRSGMGGGGRGGMGGGRGGAGRGGESGQEKSGLAEASDFWVKMALAR